MSGHHFSENDSSGSYEQKMADWTVPSYSTHFTRSGRQPSGRRGDGQVKVVLFGATGMVGQGVLRECLLDPDVESVVSVGRGATGHYHPKLLELEHSNFLDFSAIENQLQGFDACFFCLGVSSAGMSEENYEQVTYGFTIAAARALVK